MLNSVKYNMQDLEWIYFRIIIFKCEYDLAILQYIYWGKQPIIWLKHWPNLLTQLTCLYMYENTILFLNDFLFLADIVIHMK